MDPDLEQLAKLSASFRQLLATIVLTLLIAPILGYAAYQIIPSTKFAAFALLAAVVGAMAIGTRVPTGASRFPTIRALRDRTADVAHIVALDRASKHMIGLFDRSQNLIAKPLVLKGTAALPSGAGATRAIAADKSTLERALAIIHARCPNAKIARIEDRIGVRSFKALARKAIAGQG